MMPDEKNFSPDMVSERWLERTGNQEKKLNTYRSDASLGSIVMDIQDNKFII